MSKATALVSFLVVAILCLTIGITIWALAHSTKSVNRSNIYVDKNNITSESDNERDKGDENNNDFVIENDIDSPILPESHQKGNSKKKDEYTEEEYFDICDPCTKSTLKTHTEKSSGSICNGLFSSAEENLTAELPVFGYGTENVYANCHDLEVDIRSAASIIINFEIKREMKNPRNMNNPHLKASLAYSPNAKINHDLSSIDTDTEDSFGTNNQNEGADEGDVVKSNGIHAFLGSGDTIVAWDVHTGALLSSTTLTSSRELDIQSILLHEHRLLVIFKSKKINLIERNVVFSKYDTFVNIYDISNLPNDGSELELFATHSLQGGSYTAARSVDSIAHIVTSSVIDVLQRLQNPFLKRKPRYFDLSSTEYRSTAINYATKIVIPQFTALMMTHLKSEEGTCNQIVKLSMFQSVDHTCTGEVLPVYARQRIMDSLVTITTFNMTSRNSPETNLRNGSNELILNVSRTNAFMPSYDDILVYSTSDYLFVSGRGFQYTNTSWVDQTFIMAFALNSGNNGIKIRGFGSVPGIIKNSLAFDVLKGHLRIVSGNARTVTCIKSETHEINGASNTNCVWTQEHNRTNHMTILKIPSDVQFKNTHMTRTGYLGEIGEGEKIISVRFMEGQAFIVTFYRGGNLFTIDVSDHSNPKLVGKLKHPGFVTYLYPYDSHGNILVAIGRNATKTGITKGLQISLFNASNFAEPYVLDVYHIEDNISRSNAEYDYTSFRFLPESKRLIIPVRITGQQEFDGFLIFNLKVDQKLSLLFFISHSEATNRKCWKRKYFPGHSLVHDNILTTIKAHSIIAHDLETRQKTWELALNDTRACFVMGWAN